jgi:hypothetical protein
MIIRRFVIALRQQDWATVTIEFLIVVAGIFVGLQVDDWNRSRVAAAEERHLLVDLHRETQISINIQSGFNQRLGGWLEGTKAVINALDTNTLHKLDDQEIAFGLITSTWNPPFSFPTQVLEKYDRLAGLQVLATPDLRRSIALYRSAIVMAEGAIKADAARVPFILDAAKGGLVPRLDDESQPFGVSYSVDREALQSLPDFRRQLFIAYRAQKNAHLHHRANMLTRAKDACNALAKYLELEACTVPGKSGPQA